MGGWTKTGDNTWTSDNGQNWTKTGENTWTRSDGANITKTNDNHWEWGGTSDAGDDSWFPEMDNDNDE